ncbi:hypothetical protein LDVICp184 [lymphocystis disease virus-China]|uniref:Protein kinase domain-containing protein n=2 Tax=Lymphocystis disease virus 2 TaxID=159183 RepID=A0A6F8X3G9_9VIRU|nr:hypothetical protein LDVICp184 [lymphocystis disease virus-China]AAU11028.1 hypothetical protein [lymphocystis disease virus-China]BCB67523.1 hypothetical protein [Lymphocystis disease virus 2]
MKYEDFIKKCKDPLFVCESFERNPTVNPITSRKILQRGQIYKNLTKFCDSIRSINAKTVIEVETDRISYMKKVRISLRSLNLDRGAYCVTKEDSILRNFLDEVELLDIGGFGRIYKVSYKGLKFVFKEILLEEADRKVLKDKESLFWDQWTKVYPLEIYIFKLTDRLIETDKSPHFVYSAGGGLCSNCILSTLNYKRKKGSCYVAAMELADFTLSDILDDLSDENVKIAIQQLLLGLAVLHTEYGIFHGDLKTDNILVKRVEPGGYVKYELFDRVFYIKNTGLLFLIADFNVSKIYRGKYALTKYRGNKYTEVISTGLSPGWGNEAGHEITLKPFSTRKFLSFGKNHKMEIIDNTYLRQWFDNKGNCVGRYTINRFSVGVDVGSDLIVDFDDMRRFNEFTFAYDIQDILAMFKGGKSFTQSYTHKGRCKSITFLNDLILSKVNAPELYNISAGKYFFADITAAYLFPETKIYKPVFHKYVYKG